MNAHDADALGALYADDGVYSEPAGGFRGREAIVQYWERFFAAFPDLDVRDEFKAENGTLRSTSGRCRGRTPGHWKRPKAPFLRPASG